MRYGVKRRSRGFTLTELAVVMGVAGIILGAIWTASGSNHKMQLANDSITELQTISQNIVNLMQGRKFPLGSGYPNDIGNSMYASQAIPSIYGPIIASYGGFNSPWETGGAVVRALSATTFQIVFFTPPDIQTCINMLLAATNCQVGQIACPIKIFTAGETVGLSPSASGWQSVATVSALQDMCQANLTAQYSSVVFRYSL